MADELLKYLVTVNAATGATVKVQKVGPSGELEEVPVPAPQAAACPPGGQAPGTWYPGPPGPGYPQPAAPWGAPPQVAWGAPMASPYPVPSMAPSYGSPWPGWPPCAMSQPAVPWYPQPGCPHAAAGFTQPPQFTPEQEVPPFPITQPPMPSAEHKAMAELEVPPFPITQPPMPSAQAAAGEQAMSEQAQEATERKTAAN